MLKLDKILKKKGKKTLARKIVDVNNIKGVFAPMFPDHVYVEKPESLSKEHINRLFNKQKPDLQGKIWRHAVKMLYQ